MADVCAHVEFHVDGGLRRGTDVVKALALGARAVGFGRAILYALAAGGAPAVTDAIAMLERDLDRTLGHIGCARVDALGSQYVRKA